MGGTRLEAIGTDAIEERGVLSETWMEGGWVICCERRVGVGGTWPIGLFAVEVSAMALGKRGKAIVGYLPE